MHIVLEGNDAAGKSTLAQKLHERTGLPIIPSEGPEKYPGEINERILRYLALKDPVIFDRHPCISQPIYKMLVHNGTMPHDDLIAEFYRQDPVIVYCRSDLGERGFERHEAREGETEEHLQSVKERYVELTRAYDAWALERANLVYVLGRQLKWTVETIANAWAYRQYVG